MCGQVAVHMRTQRSGSATDHEKNGTDGGSGADMSKVTHQESDGQSRRCPRLETEDLVWNDSVRLAKGGEVKVRLCKVHFSKTPLQMTTKTNSWE